MREKIIARLKAKYSGVNLSNARLNQIADKLASKITDENEIDAKLDELNDVMPFSDIAKQDDRLRTLEAKNKKPDAKPKPDEDTDDDDETDDVKPKGKVKKTDEPPAWAKGLIANVNSLMSDKTQTTMKQKLAEKLKDVPEVFWSKRAFPENDDAIEDFVTDVTTDWTNLKQDKKNEGLWETKPPGGDGKTELKPTGKEDDEIKAWATKTDTTKNDTTKK